MKKLNASFTPLLFLILTIFATACNNEPEAPSVLQLVSSSGQNYVSENRKVSGGTQVITGVYAQAPSDNVSLINFKVTFTYDTTSTPDPKNIITYLDSTLGPDTKTFAMPIAYTVRNLAHKEIWNFTVTDSNNKTYQRVVRITTTSTANKANSTFYTYTNVLLSRLKAPENPLADTLGFFGFASETGTSFPSYAVKQSGVASKIDLLFNKINTQKPSLSLNKGNSLILTTLTTDDFEAFANITNLKNAYPKDAPGVTQLENLKTDQVLAFKSVSDKVGLLRIKAVYKTLDSLAFDVKVEK